MATTKVDFMRYRNATGEPVWTFNIKQDGQPTFETEGSWEKLEQCLEAYFDYAGYSEVVVAPGISFPGGHGPLLQTNDDLYHIEREVDDPPEDDLESEVVV